MKHFTLKKHLAALLLLLCGTVAMAHDFEVDGIYYNITDADARTVEVTYEGDDYYSAKYDGSVTIPESVVYGGVTYNVTTIGEYAFYDCSGLTSITIPNSVTTIGDYAFEHCSGLTSITIGNSVTTIGNDAFRDCSGLTSITIGNSVTTIGNDAFRDCSGLTSITIGNSVTTIGDEAFMFCNGLTSIVVESGNTKYDSREDCNAIIETATNTLVAGCKNTVIPNSVTTIGNDAFRDCTGLTSITIPNSVTTIGQSAFYGCTGLTSITIPNSVTTIGEYAFQGCSGFTSIVVESGNTNYDSREGCNAIIETATNKLVAGCKNTVIPGSVTTIGNNAFSNCTGLTSITIPNSVTTIGDQAFFGCTGLTSITIPNSVTTIGYTAFYKCTGLTSITIPGSVTKIEEDTFQETGWWNNQPDGLIYKDGWLLGYKGNEPSGDIVIADGTKGIAIDAFNYCDGLTSVTIPNSVTTIGEYAFYDCDGLTSVTIGNSVTEIGKYAFYGCTGLTSITIPGSVTTMGSRVFKGCSSLTSVTIGNSVTRIGFQAFSDCSGLTSITILATTPPNLDNQYGINSEVVLYVPIGTKERYENSEIYSHHFSRIEDCIYNDGAEYSYNNIKERTRIIYNRDFPDTAWQAWYLPFDVPYSAVADELEVAYLNDVHQFDDDKDGNIDRTELEVILLTEGTIEANYPYVVRAKNAGNKKFDLPDVAIVPFEENYIDCSSVNVKYTFTGTHTAVNVFDAYSDGCYNIVNGEIVAPTEPEGQKQEDQVTTTETEVTDLAQLGNSKLYTIASARCFLLYSSKSSLSNKLCTSSGSALGNVTRDINDLNQLFQIVKEGDAYYLYSVGAGKYINKDGNYTNSKSDALTLEHVGGTYPWKLCLGGNGMNSQESGQFDNGIVVNSWTDTDAGNCYKIVEIEKQVIKGENPTAIEAGRWYLQMEARNSMTKLPSRIAIRVSGKEIGTTGIDEVESEGSFNGLPNTYYDLQGRIVEQPTHGIYIYNGKKLFVK